MYQKAQDILLIRTGGTIESEPYPDPHNPPEHVQPLLGDQSLVEPWLEGTRYHHVSCYHWGYWEEDKFVKDSKAFTAADLRQLAEVIANADQKYIVLTHGTDAMIDNVKQLKELLADSGKVVLITGSMVPLSMRRQHAGDAVHNLRFALDTVTQLPPGTYIAARNAQTMRSEILDPELYEKALEISQPDLSFTLRLKQQEQAPPPSPPSRRG